MTRNVSKSHFKPSFFPHLSRLRGHVRVPEVRRGEQPGDDGLEHPQPDHPAGVRGQQRPRGQRGGQVVLEDREDAVLQGVPDGGVEVGQLDVAGALGLKVAEVALNKVLRFVLATKLT